MAQKETYRINFNEDYGDFMAGESKTGLTFDQQLDYAMEHFSAKKSGIFTIEPEFKIKQEKETAGVVNIKVKKSDTEAYKDALELYYNSLDAVSMLQIKDGTRKICHSEDMGFYLRDTKQAGKVTGSNGAGSEINISVVHIREKEKIEIHKSMKQILLGSIRSQFYYDNGMFEHEDLIEIVNELFKGKC